MTRSIADALAIGRKDIAAIDARLLLQHVLDCTHADLIARKNDPLADELFQRFLKLVARREAHEPVSKIIGRREFYGHVFRVSEHVLDPRADTETIVDLCLAGKARRILDLGVGSGAILLSLLVEWPEANGVGVDISPLALEVAAQNVQSLRLRARVKLTESLWFEKVEGQFDLIVSNPPYIPRADIVGLEPDVRSFDPHLALDGGDDGLEAYRAIAAEAGNFLARNGRIVLEIGQGQQPDVQQIFESRGFSFESARPDLSGIVRALQFVHSS